MLPDTFVDCLPAYHTLAGEEEESRMDKKFEHDGVELLFTRFHTTLLVVDWKMMGFADVPIALKFATVSVVLAPKSTVVPGTTLNVSKVVLFVPAVCSWIVPAPPRRDTVP